MTSRGSSIAAIWAISTWPAVNFIASNWNDVHRGGWGCLAGVFAITLALGLAGHGLQWHAARSKQVDVVVPWAVAICLFFGYLAMRDAFQLVFKRVGVGVPPIVCWLLCVAVAIFYAWRARGSRSLQIAASTFSFVAWGSAVVLLATTAWRAPAASEPAPVAGRPMNQPVDGHRGVNIYYIVLDAYAGKRTLRESLSFDNSPFLDRMAARGFRDVSSERSNYLRTQQTLGGIFSLQYPQTDDPHSWKDAARLYPDLLDSQTPAPLIAGLQANGYSTWFSASVVAGCPARQLLCLSDHVTVNATYIAQSFLAPTPVGRALMHAVERRRNALDPVARRLPSMLARHQPTFVFAHHISPHPPYSLDRNCEPVRSGLEMWEDSRAGQRSGYVGALECVNAQAERLVDLIVALDPRAMIILQSDHGPDIDLNWREPMSSWSDAVIRERASYLNLVRAPADCARWLDRPIGQINTARFVLACVQGRAPEFLPEHTYISSYHPGNEGYLVRDWIPANR